MLNKGCKRCGSFAINPKEHGRMPGRYLDLCDVCYWREIAETTMPKKDIEGKETLMMVVMLGDSPLYTTVANLDSPGTYTIPKTHQGFRDSDMLYLEDQYGYRYTRQASTGKLAYFSRI